MAQIVIVPTTPWVSAVEFGPCSFDPAGLGAVALAWKKPAVCAVADQLRQPFLPRGRLRSRQHPVDRDLPIGGGCLSEKLRRPLIAGQLRGELGRQQQLAVLSYA